MKKLLLLYAIGVLVILAGIWKYWGFAFQVPGVDSRFLQAERILSVSPVISKYNSNKNINLENGSIYPLKKSFSDHVLEVRENWTDLHEYPLYRFINVTADDVLPKEYTNADSSTLSQISNLISPNTFLTNSTSNFSTDYIAYFGDVVVAEHPKLGKIILLGLRGPQKTNDHYPYQEKLFQVDEAGNISLLSTTQFYFDVAGLEQLTPLVAILK